MRPPFAKVVSCARPPHPCRAPARNMLWGKSRFVLAHARRGLYPACIAAPRRSVSSAASSQANGLLDAEQSGLLSVRERLRREPLDRDVLELISELQLGLPRRGRRQRRSGDKVSDTGASTNIFARVGFLHAAHAASNLPPPPLAEIAFAGRSNVGKSSLLNALAGKSCGSRGTIGVAAVANRPGVTRSINFYSNAHGAQLVDLPGYGFAFAQAEEVARWQTTMRDYLSSRGKPLRVLLILDARQSLKQTDREFLLWLDREARVPLHVVMSKCDLVSAPELARRYTVLGTELRALQLEHHVPPHFMISSKTGGGIELLRASLAVALPSKLLGSAAKRGARRLEKPLSTVDEVEVATPAARRFAQQLEARRAKATQAMQPEALGREQRQAVARDFFLQRRARRVGH